MIFLSKTLVEQAGENVILRNYQLSGEYDSTARIDRARTLDGGGVLTHHGVSVTDRNFQVDCRLTPEEFKNLSTLHENAAVLRISFWEGVFLGHIYRLQAQRDGTARIIIYFSEKMA